MLNQISSCLAAFILFGFLLFSLDWYLFSQPSIYKQKQQLCLTRSKQAKILILGSSHALFGIRPDKFSEPALNLANVSQSLDLDEQLLQKVLRQTPELKLVIVPVSYFSLEESLTATAEEWRDCLYLRYFGVSERSPWQICQDLRYWSLPVLYRSYSIGPPHVPDDCTLASYRVDDYGWATNNKLLSATQAEEMGKERVKLFQSFMKPASFKAHKKILQRMIDSCRNRHIKVLLVTTPLWTTFRKFASSDRIFQMRSLLEFLTVPKEVAYADYSSDSRFLLSDFADTDHLNSNGAAKFSCLLDQEFIRPMLASGSNQLFSKSPL